MLPSRCRLWIAILSMLCAAHSVLAGEGMSITAPTKIKPESRVTISWSGGKATFTVRILVNSHEFSELKSIADTWYTWTAQGVKDGDQVQFYVYDSAGASTKSPHIPVRVKADSSSDNTSSKSGESRTKQSVTSEAAETYSDSKATVAGDGGNEVVVKSTETTTTSTATGTRSGRIPTAPPQSSYAPESTTTPSSESATSSSSSSNVLTTDAPAPEATSAPTTPPTAPSAADPATPPSTSTTTSTSPDRTNLYLGLIGILIALVLLLVLVWWWRKQTGSSAGDDDSRRATRQDQEQYQSLPKRLAIKRRARMRNAQGLNVASERALLRSEEGQSFDDESETDERQAQRSKLFVPAAPLFGRTRSSDPG